MGARLGVITCDKCHEPMTGKQPVVIIAEGIVAVSANNLTFRRACVRYTCHLSCLDGVEQSDEYKIFEEIVPAKQYANVPRENLIVYCIATVVKKGEACSFERLVKECFTLFPKSFSYSRYPEWPDSLKFDRTLRTLRERGWIVGGSKTLFSLTKFGESVAKETEMELKGSGLSGKRSRKLSRSVDTVLVDSLRGSAAYKKFLERREKVSVSEMELRGLLQCTLETPVRVLKQNLQYSKNLAIEYHDNELLAFLEACDRILVGR